MEQELMLLKDLSVSDKKSLQEFLLKLMEESGELAESVMSSLKMDGTEYKNKTVENVKEESIDCMIVALAIYFKSGGKEKDLSGKVHDKLVKWGKNIK